MLAPRTEMKRKFHFQKKNKALCTKYRFPEFIRGFRGFRGFGGFQGFSGKGPNQAGPALGSTRAGDKI